MALSRCLYDIREISAIMATFGIWVIRELFVLAVVTALSCENLVLTSIWRFANSVDWDGSDQIRYVNVQRARYVEM